MGRGRARAKQAKVARQLKYSGGGTDLDRLRAELGVDSDRHGVNGDSAQADLGDQYAGDDEDDEDDEGDDWDADEDGADGLVQGSGWSAGSSAGA
jgi:hypothetical protein